MSLDQLHLAANHIADGLSVIGDTLGELLDDVKRQIDAGQSDALLLSVEVVLTGALCNIDRAIDSADELVDELDEAVEEKSEQGEEGG